MLMWRNITHVVVESLCPHGVVHLHYIERELLLGNSEESEILRGDRLASQGFLVDRAAVAVFECRHV